LAVHCAVCDTARLPKQFQEKWKPVFRPELREDKQLETIIDSMKR